MSESNLSTNPFEQQKGAEEKERHQQDEQENFEPPLAHDFKLTFELGLHKRFREVTGIILPQLNTFPIELPPKPRHLALGELARFGLYEFNRLG